MKIRSFSALVASGVLLATATLALSGCGVVVLYKTPEYGYAGRPVPPSKLLERVLAAYTGNGTSSGGLEILDGLRDLRGNVQNTTKSYSISGYSEGEPISIINFPEETSGYVLSYNDGNLIDINYSKETASGTVANFGATSPSAAAAPLGTAFAGAAEQAGEIIFSTGGTSYTLNLPGVDKVVIDPGDSVVLAMVQNSDTLYRIVKLPATPNPVFPPGYVDCEPLLLPAYCVVPVAGTYDRPVNVNFSLDGSTAYVLNSGPENGGTTASVSFLNMAPLNINIVPTVNPLGAGAPSPMATLPVANPVPVPGGVTAAVADGTYLYLSGQQLQTTGAYKGLFAGNLSLLNLSTYAVGAPIPISDGTHTKMLFADNNTLWIGSSNCANGVRAATAAKELASQGYTDQAGNYNCLTMATTGTATPTATIIPAVVQSNVSTVTPVTVPYPNTNQNQYYYGSLTGLCWVQNYFKVYTAYGGQIHAFYTGPNPSPIVETQQEDENGGTPGSEIDNINVTVQGTVFDVAYMDAETDSAD
ncbi:MAG: hypothetical protein WBY53_19210 [Acidobacteriaceae bacterium]